MVKKKIRQSEEHYLRRFTRLYPTRAKRSDRVKLQLFRAMMNEWQTTHHVPDYVRDSPHVVFDPRYAGFWDTKYTALDLQQCSMWHIHYPPLSFEWPPASAPAPNAPSMGEDTAVLSDCSTPDIAGFHFSGCSDEMPQ